MDPNGKPEREGCMKSDESPTARALLALELLQGNPGITADQLAGKLGVSDRAARRYVGILREAGIPIESVRGPYGGYHVGRGLRLPPLMFSATEALGLVMAVLDGHHAAADPTDPVGSALGKIMRALPQPVAAQAEAVRRATAPAPDRAAARPEPGTTTAVVQACASRQRLRIGYRSEAGSEWHMEVDPWAVVVRHGRWYLLCWSHSARARRTYRIDRVRNVEVLDATFSPPADLDPVATLEENLGVGWEYEVEVLIDAPFETAGRCLPRTMGKLQVVDAATCRLTGSTSNPWMYAQQLAGMPSSYRIVRGSEVQRAARLLGERLLAAGDTGTAGDNSTAGANSTPGDNAAAGPGGGSGPAAVGRD
jgi:predicted DNA-binding transcriptional regulator YafY